MLKPVRRVRVRNLRLCAAAAGVAAALALTGCSDSGSDGNADDKDTAKPTTSAGASAGTGGGSGDGDGEGGGSGGDGKSASLDGSWVAMTDGKPIGLIVDGKKAALFGLEGTTCSGSVGDVKGSQAFRLTCKGDSSRTAGRVESVDATSMKVSWEGLGDETFQKSDDGKLPGGLRTPLPRP
ncbi:hypothetical protein [Streptomyces apocyni]|uniref:hypothetical protein n=1 Tax=Streptomyces apocyni TaxID=2654677 RepID=UPI001E51F188|nr:hypothetical protein [Streptomyces apocyni]